MGPALQRFMNFFLNREWITCTQNDTFIGIWLLAMF